MLLVLLLPKIVAVLAVAAVAVVVAVAVAAVVAVHIKPFETQYTDGELH